MVTKQGMEKVKREDFMVTKEDCMDTKLVCHKCGKDWVGMSSPNYCSHCGEPSAAIVVEAKK